MIERRLREEVDRGLSRQPAVCMFGPRQVGKTTLAHEVAASRPSNYIDLEAPSDRARLAEPELYFADHANELVVLDEIQRLPGLFDVLRGVIDRGRREGSGTGRFLLLGSASPELIRQSGETLAGRVSDLALDPLDLTEADDGARLWLRGGFPESYLAADDRDSLDWRADLIRTYLERDTPQLGSRVPAETLRRFWTMLAHNQGAVLNAARLAQGLGVASTTVSRYVDLLVDLLLVRRLEPWSSNLGKRVVKSPKVYVRDSGVLHALLGIEDREALLGHPVVGPSWEGFVIENLLAVAGDRVQASFYRSAGGAEIDLLLTWPDARTWAVEVKRTAAPKAERGLSSALDTVEPERAFVVYPGTDRYPVASNVEAIPPTDLCRLVAEGPKGSLDA